MALCLCCTNALNDSFGWGSLAPIYRVCDELTMASWHDQVVRSLTLVCLVARDQLWCTDMQGHLLLDPLRATRQNIRSLMILSSHALHDLNLISMVLSELVDSLGFLCLSLDLMLAWFSLLNGNCVDPLESSCTFFLEEFTRILKWIQVSL